MIIDFIAREETIPNLYIGKLIVKSDKEKKEILVVIEIESKQSLFDVEVTIDNEHLEILSGTILPVEVNLFNLGATKRIDANVEIMIKNLKGEEIISKSRTIAVKTQMSYIENLQISKNIISGEYIVYVKVTYGGNIASAITKFNVNKKSFLEKESTKIIVIILEIITILFSMYELIKFFIRKFF